ncbi:MAG: hypothetical protein ACO1RT_06310 [Planctomycetaceae bacterium]
MKKTMFSPFTLYVVENPSKVFMGDPIDGDIANCPAVTHDPEDGKYYIRVDGSPRRLRVTQIIESRRSKRAWRRAQGGRYRVHDVFCTDTIRSDDFDRLVDFAVLLNRAGAGEAPILQNSESLSKMGRRVHERLVTGAGDRASVIRWCETVMREATVRESHHARTAEGAAV